MNDWARELIEEMDREGAADHDAGRAFRRAYAAGDSVEAAEAFDAMAARVIDASNAGYAGTHECHIFTDGSCYCTWREGIDRFFPEASMLADEERDSDPELAAKIDAAYEAI